MKKLDILTFCLGKRFLRDSHILLTVIVAAFAICLAGCVGSVLPSLREPDRLYTPQAELTAVRDQLGQLAWDINAPPTPEQRNSYISLRMYAIDENYTIYEKQLTHEAQETGLVASLINLGLTGAGSVAPTAEVGKALSAAATGFTGASQAYDKDVLLAQSVQNLQTEMRADRNAKAAVILTSMQCPISSYNMGMALSDLEEYYRAGTMPNALIALSKTVGNAESQAKDAKAAANPAAQIQKAGADRIEQRKSIETTPVNSDVSPRCASLAATVEINTLQGDHTRPPPPPHPPHTSRPASTCTLASPLFADPTDCQAINSALRDFKKAASQSEARQICHDISDLSNKLGVVSICAVN